MTHFVLYNPIVKRYVRKGSTSSGLRFTTSLACAKFFSSEWSIQNFVKRTRMVLSDQFAITKIIVQDEE